MSHTVLTLDISNSPALLTVARFEGSVLHCLHKESIDLGSLFTPNEDSSDTEEQEHADINAEFTEQELQVVQSLRESINAIQQPWTSFYLVISSTHQLTHSLTLPFGDKKSIARVIDLEVQDVVPFDIDEFVVDYHAVRAHDEGGHIVHTALVPRNIIARSLKVTHALELEPRMITNCVGSLVGALELSPSYFDDSGVLIWLDRNNGGILALDQGEPIYSRSLNLQKIFPKGTITPQVLANEIKVAIVSFEKKLQRQVSTIYLFGEMLDAELLKSTLARNVETLAVSEFVQGEQTSHSLGLLASGITPEIMEESGLINFRIGEFAYSPQIKELVAGARKAAPWLGGALALASLLLFCLYQIRSYKIGSLEESITASARQVDTSISSTGKTAVDEVIKKINEVEGRLKDLGSFSSISALDALLDISEQMPAPSEEVSVSSLSINENRITLKGSAPNYSKIDDLLSKFEKKNGQIYCKIQKKEPGGAEKGKRGFQFDLELC